MKLILLTFILTLSITTIFPQQGGNRTQIENDDWGPDSPWPLPIPGPCQAIICDDSPDSEDDCPPGFCKTISFNNNNQLLSFHNIITKTKQSDIGFAYDLILDNPNMTVDIIGINSGSYQKLNLMIQNDISNIDISHLNLSIGLYFIRLRHGQYIYTTAKFAIK